MGNTVLHVAQTSAKGHCLGARFENGHQQIVCCSLEKGVNFTVTLKAMV
jgi:hypothetical protein